MQLEDLEEDEEDEEEDLLGLGGDESAPSSKVPATFSRPSLAPPPPHLLRKGRRLPSPRPALLPARHKGQIEGGNRLFLLFLYLNVEYKPYANQIDAEKVLPRRASS